MIEPMSRRDFLKLGGASMVSLALSRGADTLRVQGFPQHESLGRVLEAKVELKSRPRPDSQTVATLSQDDVVAWLREVVGVHPQQVTQVWVETPEGFIHSAALQPVRNVGNAPERGLPATSLGPGMWAEVTVPWVDFVLDNPPARSPWLQYTERPRFYYSQILWVDQIRIEESGAAWYRINERFGFGDRMWAPAEAFRRITPEEVAPISPGREDKRVVVRLRDQSISCFEGRSEVFFARVSNGVNFDPVGNPIDRSSTPAGPHPIWRKLISLHMVGGTTGGGWDLPGIGWTSLFVGNGVAVHSTYWHNDFGAPRSRGCVNARPDDAKWVFRWVDPVVPYDPGDVTVSMPGGTIVEVIEA